MGADSGADRPTAAAARSAAEAGSAATAEADRVKPAAAGSAADASAYQYHAAAYPGRGAGNWVEEAPKTTAEKKDDRSWMIQCGPLKAPSRPKPSALSWL